MKLIIKNSIRIKILLLASLFVILTLIIFSLVVYNQRINSIKHNAYDKLKALRELKVLQINEWLDKISGDMKTLAHNSLIKKTSHHLCAGTISQRNANVTLDAIFSNYIQNYNYYYEFFLINIRTGRVTYSTNPERLGKDASTNVYYTGPLKNNNLYIKDIYYSKNLQIPTMTFSIPVFRQSYSGRAACGILVGRIFLERSLYSFLSDKTGMGASGETIIINKDRVPLNKLRGRDEVNLSLKLHDKASFLSAKRMTGIVETTDYRGREVLSAYTSIRRTGWGFIAKQDIAEIYKPISVMLKQIIGLLVIFTLIVCTVTIFATSRLLKPMYKIIEVASKIIDGNFSKRITTNRTDELSFIARAFNRMADHLVSELDFQKTCSDIIEDMAATIDLKNFSLKILNKMVEITGSCIGAFYILSDDKKEFKPLTSIGISTDAIHTFQAERLEGDFGRALALQKVTSTKLDPDKTRLSLKTTIGEVFPQELLTIPIIVDDRTAAIISLAHLDSYSDIVYRVIDQIQLVMNTVFSNILSIDERKKLAVELAEKNKLLENKQNTLKTQTIELQRQTEMVKKQNKELYQQRKIVEDASRLKSEFLSNMSHELRTPLNSILSLSRVIITNSQKNLSDEEAGYMDIIKRNGEHLLALINDILDLSKIESGRIDLKPRIIALQTVLTNITDNFEQIAEDKGISISLNMPGELADIETDEARLYQIFQNIIGNAVKFTEHGSVTVDVMQDNESTTVDIADTGIGIAGEDLPHIFEEFRQIDGTLTRKYEGTGLGLAIAHKSAQLVGGSISVESTLGEGSTFTVRLPLLWTAEQTDQKMNRPDKQNSLYAVDNEIYNKIYSEIGPAKVLIIEDDLDNIVTLKAILQNEYEIIEAHDGKDGLEKALSEKPYVILLDIALPKMNGFMVAKKLKENNITKEIPVISMTALSMKGDKERILEAGCDDYISKPFNIEHMKKILKYWIIKRYEKSSGNR